LCRAELAPFSEETMLDVTYDYASCVRHSEKVAWKVDDVLPADTRLDFSRRFLPDRLSGSGRIHCLSESDRLMLNHINGNSYINLFAFVEEYIVATVVNHAQAEMFGDHSAIRALTRFAEEEIKHQELFWRYLATFKRDFGHPCEVLGSAAAVAQVILSKNAIAVMLVTLHLEIMTQAHYTECFRTDVELDPLFVRLLKHHWMEEAQHAKIDVLELDKLLADAAREQIQKAFTDYLDLIDAFDGLLAQQAAMDRDSLSRALSRTFSAEESAEIAAAQHHSYRWTFLVSGMVNPMFVNVLKRIDPSAAERIAQKAASLS
jgi:hypothetical protein